MTDDERVPAPVDAALARIEGMLGKGFADLEGKVNLVLQRADQTDERLKEQARILTDYDSRLRTVESTMATQDCVRELDARFDGTVTKDELAQRQGRTRWLVGLMVSVAAIAVTGAVGLLNTLL